MRMEADDVTAIVEAAGLLLNRSIELPPYHYGVVLGLPVDAVALRQEVKSK